MLNSIVKLLLGKQIVLYNRHRQTLPIIEDPWNKANFIFFQTVYLWKIIPFSSKSKYKFKIMYGILSFVSPKLIMDINWISKWHSLYYVWCKNHRETRFVVVQHGLYAGGVVTDAAHRYSKCQVMFCWGDYFKRLFTEYNRGKAVDFYSFGNPVYNKQQRSSFTHSSGNGKRVLLAPSGIKGQRLVELAELKDKLEQLGFEVFLKEHNFQSRLFEKIEGFKKVHENIYTILRNKQYDLVISDHSSCLLDAIYFRNNVLFFSPRYEDINYYDNAYSQFLENLAVTFRTLTNGEDVYSLVNIQAQERLFESLVTSSENALHGYLRTNRLL